MDIRGLGLAVGLAAAGAASSAQGAACYQVLQLPNGATATLSGKFKEEVEFELTLPFSEAGVTAVGIAVDTHTPAPSPAFALRITGSYSHYAQYEPELLIGKVVVQAPSYAAKGALLATSFDAAVAAAGPVAIPARAGSAMLNKKTVVELYDAQPPVSRGRQSQGRVLVALNGAPELGVVVGTKAGGDAGPKVTMKVPTKDLAERVLTTVSAVQTMQKSAAAGQCSVPGLGLPK